MTLTVVSFRLRRRGEDWPQARIRCDRSARTVPGALVRQPWIAGPLYAPPGVLELVAAFEDDGHDAVRKVFDWYEIPADTQQLGPFTLRTLGLPHFVPNVGIRLSCAEYFSGEIMLADEGLVVPLEI